MAGALFHDIPPGGLRLFLGLGLPAAAALPSLALSLLLWFFPPASGEPTRRAWQWDMAGSLTLLLLLFVEVIWRHLPHPFVLAGAVLLGVVAIKGVGLVLYLNHFLFSASHSPHLGFRRASAAFLVAFCLLASLSAWAWRAYSSAGDEVRYLLITHSLVRHGTTDVGRTVAGQEYRAFYTGAWHKDMSWDLKRAGSHIFHLVLAPAYWLGGRLGVMLLMAALTALAAVGLLAWLWRSGLSPPASGAAVLLAFGSAPILTLGQHALPDVAGLLLFVAGLMVLQRLGQAPLKAWLALSAIAVGMLLLKNRIGFLSGGVLLAGAVEQWVWFRRSSRRAAWLWAAAAGVLGLALAFGLVRSGLLLWDVGQWGRMYLDRWAAAGHWWHPIGVFLGGVGLDQEHGILLPAPIFLLALAGLPAACARLPAASRQALIPALFYIGLIGFLRWDRFFGGNGPPGRFIALVLPAGALFIGFAWQYLRRGPWRVVSLALAGLTILGSLALTLIPSAQFHKTTGAHKLLGLADRWWGHDLHHLFPSSFAAGSWWWPWLVGGALLVAAMAWAVWRESKKSPATASSWGLRQLGLAGLLLLLGLATLLGLAKMLPPSSLEAEQMTGERASLYGIVAGGAKPIGRSLASGGQVRGRMYLPGGRCVLGVVGFCGAPGQARLSLDGRPVGELPCAQGAKMVFPLSSREPGYVDLSVEWLSCPERRCYLFIDRLELRPVTGADKAGG
ncbi:MAG: hypothetical protein K9K65_05300 [Desulfarculaceae bacterium]|nr:hypothetical protein [Desulfarculaceae bacterium]MCF8046991.1 hypothetical protein [Desulfarculaceae bacterium]MCF8063612.1 hypothetical protein [Desulfarculaceae bacterium]MCF8097239.1 hypothetical protein [Desulfarculaceae bacterium]